MIHRGDSMLCRWKSKYITDLAFLASEDVFTICLCFLTAFYPVLVYPFILVFMILLIINTRSSCMHLTSSVSSSIFVIVRCYWWISLIFAFRFLDIPLSFYQFFCFVLFSSLFQPPFSRGRWTPLAFPSRFLKWKWYHLRIIHGLLFPFALSISLPIILKTLARLWKTLLLWCCIPLLQDMVP